jgi:hypothetical protein
LSNINLTKYYTENSRLIVFGKVCVAQSWVFCVVFCKVCVAQSWVFCVVFCKVCVA